MIFLRVARLLNQMSLLQQFLLFSLVTLLIGMLALGWWVGLQIEQGVINQIAAENALYVSSFIHPALENYTILNELREEDIHLLDSLMQNTPLGQKIVSMKIWDLDGRILYSSHKELVGQKFPINDYLRRAIRGEVVSTISPLDKEEDLFERGRWDRLIETYSPVSKSRTSEITSVVEFYQSVDALESEIWKAQRASWLLLGISTLVIYLLLAIFVQRASDTIERQRNELEDQVKRLNTILKQNEELHERVRRASHALSNLNERFLRKVSAELHDGPAQDLGYVLLRLDGIQEQMKKVVEAGQLDLSCYIGLQEIEGSLQHAISEIRAISAGMGLPELEPLTIQQTLERVIRVCERRAGIKVDYLWKGLDDMGSLPVKIVVYRLVQEAINNAIRYAGGKGLTVRAVGGKNNLCVEVTDSGPGFHVQDVMNRDGHLGISGMLERVNSLGGRLVIESAPGKGTTIRAVIPIPLHEEAHG